jgi:ferric-dicitrate binding protein FerR (iron transport regulator)
LDGEAYFKVQEDKKKPFIVKNGGFRVEALGTAFNLCAYSEDQKFLATLEEGKIKVSENSVGQSLVAVPGEQIRFLVREKQFDKEEVEVRNVVAWKDGRLIFDQTPFFDVVSTLSRWFNVDIKLVDPSVANYRYTATFTDESLTQVLELLKLTAPIEFTSSARSVTANNSFTKEQIQIRRDSNVQIRIQN